MDQRRIFLNSSIIQVLILGEANTSALSNLENLKIYREKLKPLENGNIQNV